MRLISFALLGLGMIGSAMGQRATDSNFELEEDASFTLGTGSPSSGAWILPHNSANWASTYKAICDADAQMVSCGEYAQGNLGIYHLIINIVGGGTASTTAECAAALGASSGFKTLLNDQDAEYEPTIFVGFNPHSINGFTPGCMVGIIANGFLTTSPVSDPNVYVAQRAYYWDLHPDFGNILTGVNPNGGSLPPEYEFKAYKAIQCAGGCGGGGEAVTTCADHTCGEGLEKYSINDDEIIGDNDADELCCTTDAANCFYPHGVAFKGGDECGCNGDCLVGKECGTDGVCVATATNEAPVNDFSGKCSAFHTTPCDTGYYYLSSQDDVDFNGETEFKSKCCGKEEVCNLSRSLIISHGRFAKNLPCGCDYDCKGHTKCVDGSCSLRDGKCDENTDCGENKICNDNVCIKSITLAVSSSGAVTTDLRTETIDDALKNLQTKAQSGDVRISIANLPANVPPIIQDIVARTGATELEVATVTNAGDDCSLADFKSETKLKLVSLSDNQCTLRCDGATKVSKLCRNSFGDYQYQCHDGSDWGTANQINVDETYTCELSNNKVYTSKVGSEIADSGVEITPVCVEAGQRVLMADGTHKNVEHLVLGDVLRTPGGTTTVRSTRRGARHLSQVHDVECAGRKGAITGNHAYHCEGEWRLPQETHKPRALTGTTDVVAVETDNYCEDRMILESGLHVETWDGRGINEWRPHSFENGRRLRCTLKGTWRDHVLQRVDSRE